MIPENITCDHILMAIQEINQKGVPPGRKARKFTLVFEGKNYPPKCVVALANKFANGRLLSPEEFGGGKETNDFLRSRGFVVNLISRGEQPKPFVVKKIEANPRQKGGHNERRKECKNIIRRMLEKQYDIVEENKRFEAGTLPEDFKSSPFYPDLLKIYQSLQQYRGHTTFVLAKKLDKMDYFVPDPGFIVELDERQHFSACRKIALMGYPPALMLGFDKRKWIELCDQINAHDNYPLFRDEQRAWYDTLRDFLPTIKPLLPTVRLYKKSLH